LVLQGKDVLVKAKTGSGKTVAYGLPLTQLILDDRQSNGNDAASRYTFGLVLVPTAELVTQVVEVLKDLTKYCRDAINVVGISTEATVEGQRARLRERPAIVVSTPTRALLHLKVGVLITRVHCERCLIIHLDKWVTGTEQIALSCR
jgi:ATP-dependent RNA helicase DDX56/DBP9